MRSANRNLTLWLLACTLALPSSYADAQSVKKPPVEEAAKKDPNVAIKAFDTGTKAYTAGKYDPAVQSLTAALANGGLPPPKMAQAYYYRGLAYKKQKKPAQALSDLTVAVWVNGGLNEADRAAAMEARNEVYREAGLGDQAPPIANAVGAPLPQAAAAAPKPSAPQAAAPTPPPVQAAAPPPAAPAVAVATAPPATPAPPAERPVWQADPNSAPPPPMPLPVAQTEPAPAAAAPSPAPAAAHDAYVPPANANQVATLSSQSVGAATEAPAMTPTSSLAAPEQQPAQQESSDVLAPLANAGSSITGFFSNMFGSGSSEQPQPATTGSTGAVEGPGWVKATRPEGPAVQVSASEPQRAPGYEAPVVAASQTTGFATTTSHAATPRSAGTASAQGKYRLQVASVRSREEADRLVQNLMSEHATQLGGAEAHIDEAVIGNMGTFYRVRLGPYANASEPKKLCTTLKPQGFDCQVVTQ